MQELEKIQELTKEIKLISKTLPEVDLEKRFLISAQDTYFLYYTQNSYKLHILKIVKY